MTRRQAARLRYLATLWAGGSVGLALATALGFWLGLNAGTTGFCFLIIIVLLSLLDSLISSLIFSVVAVGLLDFFFTQPLYSLRIDDIEDIWRLTAFFIASIVITGLVRKLNRATEMEKHQARLLDMTHDAVFVCGMDDTILYWNQGAEELYGWKRAEVKGKGPAQFLRTEFPVPLEDIKAVLARTGYWSGELVHTRRDGSKVYVASRWSLQRDDTGESIGILESNSDITERRLVEDELRRSQAAYLAEAQRLSLTGSFGWNATTGELFWSEETFRIFGYDASVKPSIDLVLQRTHPDDVALARRVVDEAARGAGEFDFEHRLLMPDGAIKTVHVRARALDREGGGGQLVGAVMDVTARTEAYGRLERSEKRYRRLFRDMPLALWQLDARGLVEMLSGLSAAGVTDIGAHLDAHPDVVPRAMDVLKIAEVNDAALRMFGAADARAMLGPMTPFWQARPDAFRRALESRFRGEARYEERTQVDTLDGRVIDVFFTTTRIDSGVTLVGFVELTDLVRAQEKLEQLQTEFAHAARISMLGELMASIAHELNQPLTAIATNAATGLLWLDRPEPNAAEASTLMRKVRADARRAGDIITRIRSMAVGHAPQRVRLSLHDVIDEAMLFLRHELQASRVAVSLDLAAAQPLVVADRTQLQQVIVNLAINAIQAMTQARMDYPLLTVRTALSAPDTVTCTIEDNGPGIAPELLDRLLERFFTTKETGMGMGLAISRSIIEGHGGILRAENGIDGIGARFTFTLPVARPNG